MPEFHIATGASPKYKQVHTSVCAASACHAWSGEAHPCISGHRKQSRLASHPRSPCRAVSLYAVALLHGEHQTSSSRLAVFPWTHQQESQQHQESSRGHHTASALTKADHPAQESSTLGSPVSSRTSTLKLRATGAMRALGGT